MNKKITTIAVSTAFAASMASGAVSAVDNPFGMTELQEGYHVAMSTKQDEGKCGDGKGKKEGKCGEAKCGGA